MYVGVRKLEAEAEEREEWHADPQQRKAQIQRLVA